MINDFHNKLVLFGAGKIGRSFIGQLFSRGGYEVVFIDIYQPVIDEINLRHNYNVVIKVGKEEEVINIQNVRAVFVGDVEQVSHEVSTASLIAISVGSNELRFVIPLIASGLLKRYKTVSASPLDIIIAENLRNAGEFVKLELEKYLPEGYPLDDRVGLIETSIGKMVPIMLKNDIEEDILQVFAERYNTLILDKLAFKNPIPEIEGIAPKDNMKAWVDRKLFIHNLGHATAAYLGHISYPESTFLYDVLSKNKLKDAVRKTMIQAVDILLKKYPGEYTMEELIRHVDDLLERFQNKALGDTIYRVGCDLKRKLAADDRLAGAIHLAWELNLPYNLILHALIYGCHFRAMDESENILASDMEFRTIYTKGIKTVLVSICGFDEVRHKKLIAEAIAFDNLIKVYYHFDN